MTTRDQYRFWGLSNLLKLAHEQSTKISPILLLIISCMVCGLALAFAAPRIDFHADEAIYLSGVPVNTSNDSGLIFHYGYLWGTLGDPTPLAARFVSICFGVLGIFSAGRALQLLLPDKARLIALLLPVTVLLSYQGPFSIVRVRPEISWLAIAALISWQIVALQCNNRRFNKVLLLTACVLLPLNHILSWFPCALIAGYLVLFGWRLIGSRMVFGCVGCMALGVVTNTGLRCLIVGSPLRLLPVLGAVESGQRATIAEFLKQVYWASPSFLRDHAATESFWTWGLSSVSPALVSHCMIATLLWLLGLVTIFWGRSWTQRYVFGLPLLILLMFYATGYYNPTYAPLVALLSVTTMLFIVFDTERPAWARGSVAVVLGLSVINGASFLSTRVFNHGDATFFSVEAELRSAVRELPADTVVVVPERFLSVVAGHSGKHSVLFKEALPSDSDFVVIDNYDFEMYKFVSDYEQRAKELSNLLQTSIADRTIAKPVYQHERLYDLVDDNRPDFATQGSWFMRNSVSYTVTTYAIENPEHLAKAKLRAVR